MNLLWLIAVYAANPQRINLIPVTVEKITNELNMKRKANFEDLRTTKKVCTERNNLNNLNFLSETAKFDDLKKQFTLLLTEVEQKLNLISSLQDKKVCKNEIFDNIRTNVANQKRIFELNLKTVQSENLEILNEVIQSSIDLFIKYISFLNKHIN